MKSNIIAAFILVSIAGAATAAQSQATDQLRALQAFGAQIKSAFDQTRGGNRITASALADFEQTLQRLHQSVASGGNTELLNKYEAIALLFGNLHARAEHTSQKHGRPNVDIEVVTDHRGASCETALGLSSSLPVKVTLSESGKGLSNAWFRFDADHPGNFRFRTDSIEADPALQVFHTCAADAPPIAANDDSFGLDASVSTKGDNQSPLLVHLTNTGLGGSIVLVLDPVNATVGGAITDAKTAQAVADANVTFYDVANYPYSFAGNTATDGNGIYSISLPAGSYFATVTAPGHIPQIYQNQPCPTFGTTTCPSDQATQLIVTDGQTLSGIDFSLDPGQRILGQVRSSSNQPLAAQLQLTDMAGNVLTYTSADSVGHYLFNTLPSGDYKVLATAGGYGSQMYDHLTCGGPLLTQCDLSKAGVVHVSSQDVTGVDFALPILSQITGTVMGADLQPIGSAQLTVLDPYGNGVAGGSTDALGNFTVGPLSIGRYYLYATATGYFSQLFSAVDCPLDCAFDLANATPINISYTGQQVAAGFDLNLLPSITGHVQDAASHLPIAGATIGISNNPPSSFGYPTLSAVSDAGGSYIVPAVPAGAYYVWAISNDHIDQVYSGVLCEESYSQYYGFASTPCSVSGATLVNVVSGQVPAPIDFALDPSSSISGTALIRAGTGSDLPAYGVQILVYDSAGLTAASANVDTQGAYRITDLAPGLYFAVAQGYLGSYVSQLWQATDCLSNCVPTAGTPISVGPNMNVTGIDFRVTRQSAVVGRVANAQGNPIAGAVVDLFQASDSSYVSSATADTGGFYVVAANAGSSYFVATEAGSGYVDQVYSGTSCPVGSAYIGLCSLNNATPIGVSSTNTVPQIVNFILQRQNKIFANGFE